MDQHTVAFSRLWRAPPLLSQAAPPPPMSCGRYLPSASKFSHSWQGAHQLKVFNLHINRVQIKSYDGTFKLSGSLFATRNVRVQYLLSHRFMRKCLQIDKQFCNKCIFSVRFTGMFRTCLNDLVFHTSAQKNSSYKSVLSEDCQSSRN